VLKKAGLNSLELAIGDERELGLCHRETMLNSREAREAEMRESLETHHRLMRSQDQRRGESRGRSEQSQSGERSAEHESQSREQREGRPRGLLQRIASDEAEARGAAKESRAGGLRQRGGALASLDQRGDQQSARGGRGERLWQSRGEALEPGGHRAKEGSETASSLPEASGESMAESHRE
jgi:hypothetical protein